MKAIAVVGFKNSGKSCLVKALAGASIPMKLFVDDILANTVRGFVKSLRGGQAPGRIKLEID